MAPARHGVRAGASGESGAGPFARTPTLALATAAAGSLTATVLHPGVPVGAVLSGFVTSVVVGTAIVLVPAVMAVALVAPSSRRVLTAGARALCAAQVGAAVAVTIGLTAPLQQLLVGDHAHDQHSTLLHLALTSCLAFVGTAAAAWFVLSPPQPHVAAPLPGRAPSRIRTTN